MKLMNSKTIEISEVTKGDIIEGNFYVDDLYCKYLHLSDDIDATHFITDWASGGFGSARLGEIHGIDSLDLEALAAADLEDEDVIYLKLTPMAA